MERKVRGREEREEGRGRERGRERGSDWPSGLFWGDTRRCKTIAKVSMPNCSRFGGFVFVVFCVDGCVGGWVRCSGVRESLCLENPDAD